MAIGEDIELQLLKIDKLIGPRDKGWDQPIHHRYNLDIQTYEFGVEANIYVYRCKVITCVSKRIGRMNEEDSNNNDNITNGVNILWEAKQMWYKTLINTDEWNWNAHMHTNAIIYYHNRWQILPYSILRLLLHQSTRRFSPPHRSSVHAHHLQLADHFQTMRTTAEHGCFRCSCKIRIWAENIANLRDTQRPIIPSGLNVGVHQLLPCHCLFRSAIVFQGLKILIDNMDFLSSTCIQFKQLATHPAAEVRVMPSFDVAVVTLTADSARFSSPCLFVCCWTCDWRSSRCSGQSS